MKKSFLIALACQAFLFLSLAYAGQSEPDISNGAAVWPQYYNGTNFKNPRIDESTRAQIVLDKWYHDIIKGDHYFIDGAFAGVASGVTKTFGVIVPSGVTKFHMVFTIGGSAMTTFEMYEGASGSTFFNSGTTATVFNSDRNCSNTSALTIIAMPNHVQSGVSTRLFHKIVGTSGANPAKDGAPGSGSRDSKIILANGKRYFVVFISGAASNDINYTSEWAERVSLGQ